MDPNAALDRIRDLIADYDECLDGNVAERIVDAIDGLDQWLSKGGFLPEAWAHARPATER